MGRNHLSLLALLASILLLGWICTNNHLPSIQGHLTFETEKELALAGLPTVIHVTVSRGRDVTLSGEVPSEAVRAQASFIARNVRGVRSVNNRLSVVAPPPRQGKISPLGGQVADPAILPTPERAIANTFAIQNIEVEPTELRVTENEP